MNVNDLIYALIICLFGMGVVFIILIGLSFITGAIKLFSNKDSKGNKDAAMQADEGSHLVEVRASEVADETGEEELAAVITAAVAICMGRENNLIVRSVRKLEDCTPVWGKVSRQEQMLNRF